MQIWKNSTAKYVNSCNAFSGLECPLAGTERQKNYGVYKEFISFAVKCSFSSVWTLFKTSVHIEPFVKQKWDLVEQKKWKFKYFSKGIIAKNQVLVITGNISIALELVRQFMKQCGAAVPVADSFFCLETNIIKYVGNTHCLGIQGPAKPEGLN